MNRKKYYYDSVPENNIIDADPQTRQVVNKFEEEKASGSDVEDVIRGIILAQEKQVVDEFNSRIVRDQNFSSHQIQLLGNTQHNTIMAQFVNQEGDVADEIVISTTPSQITDKGEYLDQFERIGLGEPQYDGLGSSLLMIL